MNLSVQTVRTYTMRELSDDELVLIQGALLLAADRGYGTASDVLKAKRLAKEINDYRRTEVDDDREEEF